LLQAWIRVVIQGKPEGAQVMLDHKIIGKTPVQPFYRPRLSFTLKVTKKGFVSKTKKIRVSESSDHVVEIPILLKKKPKLVASRPVTRVKPKEKRVTLVKEIVKPPVKKKAKPKYTWVWIVGTVVVVGATTGVVLYLTQQRPTQMQTAL